MPFCAGGIGAGAGGGGETVEGGEGVVGAGGGGAAHGFSAGFDGGAVEDVSDTSRLPHCVQNNAASGTVLPHALQVLAATLALLGHRDVGNYPARIAPKTVRWAKESAVRARFGSETARFDAQGQQTSILLHSAT